MVVIRRAQSLTDAMLTQASVSVFQGLQDLNATCARQTITGFRIKAAKVETSIIEILRFQRIIECIPNRVSLK